jgi:hypothetical protein
MRAESLMTACLAWRGHRPLLLPALGCLAGMLAVMAYPTAAVAADQVLQSTIRETVVVRLDQAKLLTLPERTATLVIGNPMIADAAVQPGAVAVITAKSYGLTNLIALDRTGSTLGEYPIQVVGPGDTTVVVYRGIDRETYSCAPKCERRITIGDTPAYFTANLAATQTFSAQAQSDQKK